MKQSDITRALVQRLRDIGKLPIRDTMQFGDVFFDAADEIVRLVDEVATWQDRYNAEKQDHEATMKAWDEERNS